MQTSQQCNANDSMEGHFLEPISKNEIISFSHIPSGAQEDICIILEQENGQNIEYLGSDTK